MCCLCARGGGSASCLQVVLSTTPPMLDERLASFVEDILPLAGGILCGPSRASCERCFAVLIHSCVSVATYSHTACVGGPSAGLGINVLIFGFFELWELCKVSTVGALAFFAPAIAYGRLFVLLFVVERGRTHVLLRMMGDQCCVRARKSRKTLIWVFHILNSGIRLRLSIR